MSYRSYIRSHGRHPFRQSLIQRIRRTWRRYMREFFAWYEIEV